LRASGNIPNTNTHNNANNNNLNLRFSGNNNNASVANNNNNMFKAPIIKMDISNSSNNNNSQRSVSPKILDLVKNSVDDVDEYEPAPIKKKDVLPPVAMNNNNSNNSNADPFVSLLESAAIANPHKNSNAKKHSSAPANFWAPVDSEYHDPSERKSLTNSNHSMSHSSEVDEIALRLSDSGPVTRAAAKKRKAASVDGKM
jgi:hypothetical protein